MRPPGDNFTDRLDLLIKWAEQVEAEWDGDMPGRGEERAGIAQDVIKKAEELKDLIAYL